MLHQLCGLPLASRCLNNVCCLLHLCYYSNVAVCLLLCCLHQLCCLLLGPRGPAATCSTSVAVLHPSNVASGVVSGYIANSAMNLIDSDNKMNKYEHDIVEGGVSGVTQAILLSKLAGTALTSGGLLTEGIGGASSYLVKDVSESLIDKGLQKVGASDEVSTDVSVVSSDALAGLTYGGISGGLPGAALGFLGGTVVGASELLEKKANLDLSNLGKDAAAGAAASLVFEVEAAPIGALVGATYGVAKSILKTKFDICYLKTKVLL